jgi:hypothetical protein
MIFSVVSDIEGRTRVTERIMSKAPRHGRVTFNSVKVALHLTRSNSRPAHAANSSPSGAMLFVTCKRNLNGKNGS